LNQDNDNLRITSTIWRRHSANCNQRTNGRYSLNCGCPLWGDGCVSSVRVLRQSLNTRNIQIARKRLGGLLDDHIESLPKDSEATRETSRIYVSDDLEVAAPDEPRVPVGTIADAPIEDPGLIANAVEAFIGSCVTNGVKPPTIRKYRNALNKLAQFVKSDENCRKKKIRKIADFAVVDLDHFRTSRKIAAITSLKELETLRGFWGFCMARDLCTKNIAAAIKAPIIVDQNDVVPYTPEEMQAMVDACATFGRHGYERKRAHAMMLTLRHTALRVSDIALMRRDRISRTRKGWRVFLRTTKNNAPVFLPIPAVMVEALDSVPPPRKSGKTCPNFFWNGHSTPKSQISEVSETLAAVFRESGVIDAGAHRFRHTLATELLGAGASFEEVADILGNSPEIVRKHYAKWSKERQERVDELMQRVHRDAWKRESSTCAL
jgi:site-specific recombinase XerD